MYDETKEVAVIVVTTGGRRIINNILARCRETAAAYGWDDKRTQDAYESALSNLGLLLAQSGGTLVRVMPDEPLEHGTSLFCSEHALTSMPEAAQVRLVYGLIGHTVWSGRDKNGRLLADPHARKWSFHS